MDDLNIQSENVDMLMPSLISAISELEDVKKSEQGYGYKYASLPAVIKELRPILKKFDLVCTQITKMINNENVLITTVYHKSGQWLRSFYPLVQAGVKGANNAQQVGAAISYARRYSLTALFFLSVEDEDDDAQCLSRNNQNNTSNRNNQNVNAWIDRARAVLNSCSTKEALDVEMSKIKAKFEEAGFKDLTKLNEIYNRKEFENGWSK